MANTVVCADIRAAVTLDAGLRAQELAFAAQMGGARWGLAHYDGSSIRTSPNDVPSSPLRWTNLDSIVNSLVASQTVSLMLIGTDIANWTAWKNVVGGSWGSEVNRPPPEAWVQWAIDVQAVVDRIRAAYTTAGLDPDWYARFQISNEINKDGAGGPWVTAGPFTYAAPFSTLLAGEIDGASAGIAGSSWTTGNARNAGEQLAYLVANVNFHGSIVVGTAHETQTGTDYDNERLSLAQIEASAEACTNMGMNHYYQWQWADSLHPDVWAQKFLDSGLTTRDELIAAYGVAGVSGMGSKACSWTEFGATMGQLKFGSDVLVKYGHFARGDYIRAFIERAVACGEFDLISLYASRERSVVADSALYGVMKSDGTYTGTYRALGRMAGDAALSPPSGSYATASGETVGIPPVETPSELLPVAPDQGSGSFTVENGGSAYEVLSDESDTTYIELTEFLSTAQAECYLEAGTDPGTNEGFYITVRAKLTNVGAEIYSITPYVINIDDVNAEPMDVTIGGNDAWTDYVFPLSAVQAAKLTSFSDLRIVASGYINSEEEPTAKIQISRIALQLPEG